jgi:nucleotide-binding universal stress UspA family protein
MFTRILVAYDGSDGAKAALRIGIGLAKSLGTELHSISVEEHLPHYAATIGPRRPATRRRSAGSSCRP